MQLHTMQYIKQLGAIFCLFPQHCYKLPYTFSFVCYFPDANEGNMRIILVGLFKFIFY